MIMLDRQLAGKLCPTFIMILFYEPTLDIWIRVCSKDDNDDGKGGVMQESWFETLK